MRTGAPALRCTVCARTTSRAAADERITKFVSSGLGSTKPKSENLDKHAQNRLRIQTQFQWARPKILARGVRATSGGPVASHLRYAGAAREARPSNASSAGPKMFQRSGRVP